MNALFFLGVLGAARGVGRAVGKSGFLPYGRRPWAGAVGKFVIKDHLRNLVAYVLRAAYGRRP